MQTPQKTKRHEPERFLDWWASRNPFTNEYVEEEAEFYGVTDYKKSGLLLHTEATLP